MHLFPGRGGLGLDAGCLEVPFVTVSSLQEEHLGSDLLRHTRSPLQRVIGQKALRTLLSIISVRYSCTTIGQPATALENHLVKWDYAGG